MCVLACASFLRISELLCILTEDLYHLSLYGYCSFRLNINIAEQVTIRVDVLEEPYGAWEFESRSEGGFLLGDPLSSLCVFEKVRGGVASSRNCDFVLDKHSVLRSDNDHVEMLNINEQQENEKKAAHIIVEQIVFSLCGETIYVVSNHVLFERTKVTAWNVSSSELIAEKECYTHHAILPSSCNCLSAVKGGVLIIGGMGTLQMWNFELSNCVRRWTNIGSVTGLIPISEERVACTTKERKLIILDSTSGEILLTTQIDHTTGLLACNSKFQILTEGMDGLVRLSDRETTLWEREQKKTMFGRFSPAIYVLDAVSGKTLHVLGSRRDMSSFSDCEFFSDEECVVISEAPSEQCVQLFNVKSGDLLSNLPLKHLPLSNVRQISPLLSILTKRKNYLAASPCKHLVAISQSDSKHGYKLIQVRLPGDEDNGKSQR